MNFYYGHNPLSITGPIMIGNLYDKNILFTKILDFKKDNSLDIKYNNDLLVFGKYNINYYNYNNNINYHYNITKFINGTSNHYDYLWHKKHVFNTLVNTGSWINTAKNYYIKDNKLYAELKKNNGTYNLDSVEFPLNYLCSNIDGYFKPNFIYNSGSWINTAKNYYIKDNKLYAELKKGDETYNLDSIELPFNCAHNINGFFKC